MNNIWGVLLVYVLFSVAALIVLYWVIKSAVLAALRTHTLNSVTAVTVLEDHTR